MGEMRDSDWSRQILLRSDWLGLIGAIMTTTALDVKFVHSVLRYSHLFFSSCKTELIHFV